METKPRSGRYVFRPARVDGLERRDVPAAAGVGALAGFKSLNATVVGTAHVDASSATYQAFDFRGAGKDSGGKLVRIEGALVAQASATADSSATGAGVLRTNRGTYQFRLQGPASELNSTSGLTNLKMTVSRPGLAPHSRGGAVARPRDVAQGAIQFHRETGAGGAPEFTASITLARLNPRGR